MPWQPQQSLAGGLFLADMPGLMNQLLEGRFLLRFPSGAGFYLILRRLEVASPLIHGTRYMLLSSKQDYILVASMAERPRRLNKLLHMEVFKKALDNLKKGWLKSCTHP
ncbi:hypothetical protein Holit_02126 [Hollandina sp. SP2]